MSYERSALGYCLVLGKGQPQMTQRTQIREICGCRSPRLRDSA